MSVSRRRDPNDGAEEMDLSEEEEAALDRVWDKIVRGEIILPPSNLDLFDEIDEMGVPLDDGPPRQSRPISVPRDAVTWDGDKFI